MSIYYTDYLLAGIKIDMDLLKENNPEAAKTIWGLYMVDDRREAKQDVQMICDQMSGHYCVIGQVFARLHPKEDTQFVEVPSMMNTAIAFEAIIHEYPELIDILKLEDMRCYLFSHHS